MLLANSQFPADEFIKIKLRNMRLIHDIEHTLSINIANSLSLSLYIYIYMYIYIYQNKYVYIYMVVQPLFFRLPTISKTIQIRRTRHVGHYWRSKAPLVV